MLEFVNLGCAQPPAPVAWLWDGLLPLGCLSLIGGPPGVGKSSLVAGLEVAIAGGSPFLERAVCGGAVIHADFDTDLRLQYPWYARAALGVGAGQATLERIRYAHPSDGGWALDAKRLIRLREEAVAGGAVLVAIDAFSSAFPFCRVNDAEAVAQVVAGLRDLASTGAAVLVLDHTPKPTPRDPGGRGLLGSQIKSASARAVHLLSRVPPTEVGGRDVLRLETHKNNLAPMLNPLGIERVWDGEALRFEVYDLGDADTGGSGVTRARRALLETLHATPEALSRDALFAQVVGRAAVASRTVERALGAALANGEVEALRLAGRGGPRRYRLPGLELDGRQIVSPDPDGLDSPPAFGGETEVAS